MDKPKFAISKEGQVYLRDRFKKWIELGHIAYVLKDGNQIAREVREWWEARLASDEPTENVVIKEEVKPGCIRLRETVVVIGSRPDLEFAEAALTAD